MERHGYIIIERPKYFLVINPKKEFEVGHTHLKSKGQAFYLCDCLHKKKIPRNVNMYFLVSLTRVATDKKYIQKVQELINTRTQKGVKDKYIVCRH